MSRTVNANYILAAGLSIVLFNMLLILTDDSSLNYVMEQFIWIGLLLCISVLKGQTESTNQIELYDEKSDIDGMQRAKLDDSTESINSQNSENLMSHNIIQYPLIIILIIASEPELLCPKN